MSYLQTHDYAIIGVYLLTLIGLGVYLKKRASASVEDYIVGGRNLPWWMLGFSGMASFLDVAGTMLIVSFLFMLGPRGLFIEFRGGAVLVLAIMMLWTGKWHRRSGCLTGAQWMRFRFGDGLSGRFAQIAKAAAVFVFTVGMLSYLAKAVGLFLSMLLPYSPETCAALLMAVAAVYTMFSGFYGVVVTDLVQSVVIIAAVVLVSVLAIDKVQGIDSLPALATQVTGNADWVKATPTTHADLFKGYEAQQSLMTFALFYLVKNLFFATGTGDDPKFFGAKNDADCAKLSFLWVCVMSIRWPLMIGFAILGLFLVNQMFPSPDLTAQASALIHQYYPDVEPAGWHSVTSGIINSPSSADPALVNALQSLLGEQAWRDKLLMVGYHGSVDPERIMPAVLLNEIPTGLRGLLLVALIAASMSTFDSNVNMAAGVFMNDIYKQYLRPAASVREAVVSTWAFILVICSVGFVFAFQVKSINDIWGWIIMGLGGGLMMPTILRLYWWRFNGSGFATGLSVGLLAAVIQRLAHPSLDERYQLFLVGGVGLVASIVGTYLSGPTDRATLTNFYRKTRPFGFWGPLKRDLDQQTRDGMAIEHRRDLLAVPIAVVFQVLLFFTPMLAMVGNWGATLVCGLALGVSLVAFWFVWLRHQRASTA
ncbi:MAG: sodium:solute symporter family transporter [Phycisphaeraceae bacterium]